MKKMILLATILASFAFNANAQLDGLIKKAKEKTDTKSTKVETKSTPANTSNTSEPVKEKAETKATGGEYPTQGITSDVHKNNMGKIVFGPSYESIAFKKEIPASFKNSFTFGEPIYVRAYLDNSLSNYLIKLLPNEDKSYINNNAHFKAHFFLDGVETFSQTLSGLQVGENQEWTSFKGALYTGDHSGSPMFRGEFITFLNGLDAKLSNGKHKIKVEIKPWINETNPVEGSVVAAGEFDFMVNPNSINTNDDIFCIAKANMTDAKVEAATMKEYALEKGNSTDVKFARIISKDWTIVRAPYTGTILRRNLDLHIVSINKEGKYVYKKCYISQEYISGKFQDKITFSSDAHETRLNSRCFTK